jgi:hypothetical protein
MPHVITTSHTHTHITTNITYTHTHNNTNNNNTTLVTHTQCVLPHTHITTALPIIIIYVINTTTHT